MRTLKIGTQIGAYTITRRLGEGGMASVYEAVRSGSKRPVALKLLLPDQNSDRDSRQRFKREMQAMQAMRHPHIVPIYDCGEADGVLYFAMRLVKGPSLFSLLARRHFSPLAAWQILFPISQALDYAHQHKVIHRDIKPGNILVESTGTRGKPGNHVYLVDFGLSKHIGEPSLTRDGLSLGTPHYMSPEQVLDRRLTPQSDVYSLAVVIYETLLGRVPFYGRKPQEIAFKQVEEKPPPPRSLHPNFPQALEAVLMKAMAKRPHYRFATAAEFSRAYAEAVQAVEPAARKEDYWVGPPA
jgi:serine/threonine protein kinase